MPPAPPGTKTKVAAAVGLSGYTVATFNTAAQTSFTSGIATLAGVATSAVTITSVTSYTVGAAGRRLLAEGVNVAFAVEVADSTSATAMTATITTATAPGNSAVLVTAMQTAGLTAVTGVELTAAPAVSQSPAVAVNSAAASTFSMPGASLVVALVALVAGAAF
jgi:hypothetical protein